MNPEVLIFDLFGTLVFFDDSRVPTMDVAGRRVPMTVADLPALLAEVLPRVEVADFVRELRKVGAAMAEQKKREGMEFHTSVRFERALVGLGAEAPSAAAAARRMAALHMDSLVRAVVCPPGRRALLGELAASYRLALLSNFDDGATARRVLAEAGLDRFFEVIVISEEEGVRKPSRVIFERTCARLAVAAAVCLYIGDTPLEDIHGATGAGLAALWIHPAGARAEADDGSPEATLHRQARSSALAVLADVDALPGWLGGGGFSARGGASR